MSPKRHKIREQQRESWNNFSSGWKKWDEEFMKFLEPMGSEIIALLKLKENDYVLDIAAGTGEPGLTIASRLQNGKIIISDLADEMLAIARDRASKKNIRNVEFIDCDACSLPFADNTFDAISCRLGFMFFPDMLIAAQEMFRVLKPGGRIATSVWDVPEKNIWVTKISGFINKNVQFPILSPDEPSMFRCAKSGLVEEIFNQAGLKNILGRQVVCKLNCTSGEVYWTMMTDISKMFFETDAMREKIKGEVLNWINEKYPEGRIIIEGSSLVIYGEK